MVTMEEQEKYLLDLLDTVVQIRTIKQNYTAITKRIAELNQQMETTTDTETLQREIDELNTLTTVRNSQVETLTLASNFYEDVACENPEELFDQLLRNLEINPETNQRTVDPQDVYNILHAALKFYTHEFRAN